VIAAAPTTQADTIDFAMMRRCLQLSEQSVAAGERPFGAVLAAGTVVVAAAGNRVEMDRDVTRHAEVVALAEAQRLLKKKDLSGLTLYSIVEPCAMCSFAIRECGIQRVVYALGSPLMGGASRWDVLSDPGLSRSMPQVFGKPPETLGGVLAADAANVWRKWNPLFWYFIKRKGYLVLPRQLASPRPTSKERTWLSRACRLLLEKASRSHAHKPG
jgi:tRNA(adenine34) deaminase